MDKATPQRAPESKRDKRDERPRPAPAPSPIAELGNRAALALARSRSAAPRIQRACACAGEPECATCGPMVKRAADGTPKTNLPHLPTTGGHGLDRDTLGFMETRFGKSFGDVRIHSDHVADTAARAVGARAFTIGRHISFASGEYSPATRGGKHLLAHELAHAAQNERAGTPSAIAMSAVEISDPHEPAELAAERAADHVMAGLPVESRELATPTLATKLYRTPCAPNPQRAGSQRNREHRLIQADYVKNVNAMGGIEFSIPGSSKEGHTGFADLVDMTTKELYEIKSIWGAFQGAYEIDTYVHEANKNCGKGWKGGTSYPQLRVIPGSATGGKVLVAGLSTPGLIVYAWLDLKEAAALAASVKAGDAAKAAKIALDKLKKKINHLELDPAFRVIRNPLAARVAEIVGDVTVGSRFLVVSASTAFIRAMGERSANDVIPRLGLNAGAAATMMFGITVIAAVAGGAILLAGGVLVIVCAPAAGAALKAALSAAASAAGAVAVMARIAIALIPRVAAAASAAMAIAVPRLAFASGTKADEEIAAETDIEFVKIVPTTKDHVTPGSQVEIGGTTHQVIGIAEVV